MSTLKPTKGEQINILKSKEAYFIIIKSKESRMNEID